MPDFIQGAPRIITFITTFVLPDVFQGAARITTLIALAALIVALAFWLLHSKFPRFKLGTLTPLQSTVVICLLLSGVFVIVIYAIYTASHRDRPNPSLEIPSDRPKAQLNVAEGWTVRDVIQTVSAFSDRSAEISTSCTEQIMSTVVKPGPISGESHLAILENLPLHTIDGAPKFRLEVVDHQSRGRYEIQCA